MRDDERRTLVLALALAGHGLHPQVPILLARRYLDVPLLPGSVVTDAMVAEAEAAVTALAARPLIRQCLTTCECGRRSEDDYHALDCPRNPVADALGQALAQDDKG